MDDVLSVAFEYLSFRVGAVILRLISFRQLTLDENTLAYWQFCLVSVVGILFWAGEIFMVERLCYFFW